MIEILVAGVFVVLFAVLAVAVWVLNIQTTLNMESDYLHRSFDSSWKHIQDMHNDIEKLEKQVNDDDEGFNKEAFDAKWGPPMSSES